MIVGGGTALHSATHLPCPGLVPSVLGKDKKRTRLFSVNQLAVAVLGEFVGSCSSATGFTREHTLSQDHCIPQTGGSVSTSPRKKPYLLPRALGLLQPQLASERAGGAFIVGIPGTVYRAGMFHWVQAASLQSAISSFFISVLLCGFERGFLKREALPNGGFSSSVFFLMEMMVTKPAVP